MKDISVTEEIKRVWAETAQRDKDLADVLAEHILDEDVVNHPSHYKSESGIEAVDVIEAFTPDVYSYYMGNVIKYVLRHMNKNQKQDLEKARWYLEAMIEDWD
jgi:hypothetical protein